MANTLTNLIPDVYAALDVVSRELVGFIPSIMRNSSADRIAQNQTLRITQTPANAAGVDITPAMSLPAASDQVMVNKTVTLSKSRAYPFSWTGEEIYSVNTGPGYLNIRQDQIAQAFRAAVNEIELFIALAMYKGASRAYGTAATTPFGTNTGESAQLKKVLDDNGAPMTGRSLIIDTTSGASLRTLTQLTKVNESGTVLTLRDGELLNLNAFSIKESAQITPVGAIGTAAAYTTDGTAYAVGATAITLITGTGTILAGDVVSFVNDTNKYVVTTGLAAPGVLTIAAPGLRKATTAVTRAVSLAAIFTPNVAFSQNAFLLATRLPVVPPEGDIALHRETVTDSRSELSFDLAVYPGYRMNRYELAINYGGTLVKPEHTAILLG